jgi:hypothetical protein
MSKKYFRLLIGVILLLVVALFAFDRAEEAAVKKDSKLLLTGVNSDQISTLLIEQGKAQVQISQENDGWGVVQRAGYSADLNKLRSLLLKLIDLNVSQVVTSNPKSFERLGVADNSYLRETDKGPLKLTLKDSSGKELAVLFLGERKKKAANKKEEGLEAGVGQFARKLGDNEVYLLPEVLEVGTSPESMVATDLLSIPSTKVKQVVQEKLSDGTAAKQFEMISVKEAEGKTRFDLDIEPNSKQEIQQTVVDSIASGLENVRIQDVQKESAESKKAFDQVTTYQLSTGAVFKVETFLEGSKAYCRIGVDFNKTLADNTTTETENLNQKRKAEYEVNKKAAEDKKETPPAEFVPLKPDVVTKDEVEKENKKYAGWIFEFPTYQIEKYRRTPDDLIKEKAAPAK